MMHVNTQLMPKASMLVLQKNRLWSPSSAQGYVAGALGETPQGSPQVMWLYAVTVRRTPAATPKSQNA